MLVNINKVKGVVVHAIDGEIGAIEQVYFDDESWAIRYLVVDAGGWLTGRQVLISPAFIVGADWKAGRVKVSLTRRQVELSPDIDTHKPVSRQHEAQYYDYFGYPYYWQGPYMWGSGYYPSGIAVPQTVCAGALTAKLIKESSDSHLRSTEAITGYYIEAADGELGHLDGFVLDDETWAIRYIEVATRNWWPGKKVLVSPDWIERVSWVDSKTYVSLTREAIKGAPEYLEDIAITREYESRLYFHYGLPPYWLQIQEAEAAQRLALV